MTEFIVVLIAILIGGAILIAGASVRIVREREVVVVERLGKFNRVLHKGIGFILPFIERERLPGIDVRIPELFAPETRIEVGRQFNLPIFPVDKPVDFKDDSATVDAGLAVQIGRSEEWVFAAYDDRSHAKHGEAVKSVEESVHRIVYAAKNPLQRARHLADEHLRAALQKKSLDEALGQKAEISSAVTATGTGSREDLEKVLDDVGLYMVSEKPLTIGDIGLRPETILNREKMQKATADAAARETEGRGLEAAVTALCGKEGITRKEALESLKEIEALRTLRGVGNLSIVASSSGGALDALLSLKRGQGGQSA